MEKIIAIVLVIAFALCLSTGCDGQQSGPISNSAKPSETVVSTTTTLSKEDKEYKEDFQTSTPDNDTDIGLKTVKVDWAESKMTDEQKNVLKYFDNDYLDAYDYEFLRRYPQVFDNAQVAMSGTIKKVISQQEAEYEALLWLGDSASDFNESEMVLIKGTTYNALFLENDFIALHGNYMGVTTTEVDGKSMTVPVVSVIDAYMPLVANRFDYTYIKTVAKSVFGENIEVRKLKGEELSGLANQEAFYAVELENQSNAKFSSYYFNTSRGDIVHSELFLNDGNGDIERHIEFSGDLEHFYVISYDWALCTFTIECYNHDLGKEWKREFEEVQPPATEGFMDRIYDYTKNNFYIALNNELYIINAETGKDTQAPIYVGPKVAVSKLKDGIFLVASGKSDVFMKIDLDGRMIWKTNAASNLWNIYCLQVNNNNIVVYSSSEDNNHYYVLNNETGVLLADAIPLQ